MTILSDIIINENLKLLQINYLTQKVYVLFNFSSRSCSTCNRTYGKTRYFSLNVFLNLLNFDHMSLACFLLLVVSFRYTRLLRI